MISLVKGGSRLINYRHFIWLILISNVAWGHVLILLATYAGSTSMDSIQRRLNYDETKTIIFLIIRAPLT